MDNNEIMCLTNGVGSALQIQREGGTVLFNNATTANCDFNGDVTADDFILSSDERLKKDILSYEVKPIDITWRTFKWKDPLKKQDTKLGVVAQELMIKHPEFVSTDETGMLQVNYNELLISKIAEQEQRIERLESLVNKLML